MPKKSGLIILLTLIWLILLIPSVGAWSYCDGAVYDYHDAYEGLSICSDYNQPAKAPWLATRINNTPEYINGFNPGIDLEWDDCMPMWGNVSNIALAAVNTGMICVYHVDFFTLIDKPIVVPECEFEISPYPANPGTLLTLTDLSTNEPEGWGWYVRDPLGSWDNTSLPITQNATYYLGMFGQYTFAHTAGNDAGYDSCSYDYWSGTNYTAITVTPTIIGNFTTNITSKNITDLWTNISLDIIDKEHFKGVIGNQSILSNYTAGYVEFIDDFTESINTTYIQVESRINPFDFLITLIMAGHNLFVILFLPLLGYVSFPLAITAATVAIIPESIQILISLGLLVDLIFLVINGGGGS